MTAAALRVVFAGTPEFAAVLLATLLESRHEVVAVYTQPDRPSGRGQKLSPGPVKQLALAGGVPVAQPRTLRDADSAGQLRALQADVMVVAAYGLILPQAILEVPRLGCVNVHASLLPRWRGAAPIQRAILAGDPETGITIMQMDAGLDTGAMLSRWPEPIRANDTAQTLHDRLAALGARALVAALDELAVGTARAVAQDSTQATYAAKLDKAEAALDWALPAEVLARRVRAFNPWPVAHTRYQGEVLRVWQAHAVHGSAAPGAYAGRSEGGVAVGSGAGLLVLDEIQLPGRRRVAAADFANAADLADARFGD